MVAAKIAKTVSDLQGSNDPHAAHGLKLYHFKPKFENKSVSLGLLTLKKLCHCRPLGRSIQCGMNDVA